MKTAVTPSWARQLVTQICVEEGVPVLEDLTIRQGTGGGVSTGRYVHSARTGRLVHRITCTFGPDFDDNRGTMIHEVAHYVTAVLRGRRHGHSLTFWRKCLELMVRHDVPAKRIARELGYKVRANTIARRMSAPRVQEALVLAKAAKPSSVSPYSFTIGARARFGATVSPKYMRGAEAVVVGYGRECVNVKLLERQGRFRAGVEIRIKPTGLDLISASA